MATILVGAGVGHTLTVDADFSLVASFSCARIGLALTTHTGLTGGAGHTRASFVASTLVAVFSRVALLANTGIRDTSTLDTDVTLDTSKGVTAVLNAGAVEANKALLAGAGTRRGKATSVAADLALCTSHDITRISLAGSRSWVTDLTHTAGYGGTGVLDTFAAEADFTRRTGHTGTGVGHTLAVLTNLIGTASHTCTGLDTVTVPTEFS